MFKRQRTIGAPASVNGTGLHTGGRTALTFKPAPINAGIRFVRTDLPGHPEIPADIEYVTDSDRGTNLEHNGARVHTVEHALAAIAGLEIDNVLIELNGAEPPAGDGSSLPFVEALQQAGIVEQDSPRDYVEIESPILYSERDGDLLRELVVLPSDDFRITFMVDYKKPTIGSQYTVLFSLENEFVTQFAPARTWTFLSEVKTLWQRGLIKGGSLESAIVMADIDLPPGELAELKELFCITGEVAVGPDGILGPSRLRFDNEPCRHKALDLIGDLALLGAPIKAHVLAARSSHAANIELVRRIRSAYKKKRFKSRYSGQSVPGKDVLLDIEGIMRILPHRYPFLLIDRVIDIEPEKHVVAIKNVTINEPFFPGHFPGHPIMPGVLIIEAMAQAGGVLLLNTIGGDPADKLAYFIGIDQARFRKPVRPGDQIRFELDMIKFRLRTCKMHGKAFVDDDLVAEADLMATVVDREQPGVSA
ncbi:MAG: bifunctional UDP-3-O-[3-hydroxymyristoyl] N-acetylglucosamine deacetylase/3-hydroxyacyl-ACP dehydratase [candidate division Zixibacteria bacterium]|nr:bifunctional UDP-3-O-[3-hydroxymyristoyl] N-acetylglucosamine deacetylase/3-hydroxyacyl-ACP dehydratase [candidate division Zixibacteria bacterium]